METLTALASWLVLGPNHRVSSWTVGCCTNIDEKSRACRRRGLTEIRTGGGVQGNSGRGSVSMTASVSISVNCMMSEEEEEEEEALWRFAVSFPQARAEYIKKCNIYS